MALTNFSLPFGALASQPWGVTISPLHMPAIHQLASNTNNLLYAPGDHQQEHAGSGGGDEGGPAALRAAYYKNNPYAPPQLHQQQQQQQQQQQYNYQFSGNNNNNAKRKNSGGGGGGNTYLPPIPPPGVQRKTVYQQQQQQYAQHLLQQQQEQQEVSNNNNNIVQKFGTSASSSSSSSSASASATSSRTYGETYSGVSVGGGGVVGSANEADSEAAQQPQQQQQQQYYNSYSSLSSGSSSSSSSTSASSKNAASSFSNSRQQQQQHHQQQQANNNNNNIEQPAASYGPAPARPPGFTRVQSGQGSRTQVHAVLDYDVEEGEEEDDENDEDENDDYNVKNQGDLDNKDDKQKGAMPTVTPIQGPIFLKNGSVPVVPLFSYPTFNNGSFVQIPIWWTALSVALGLDVRGDIIKGVPCIKRYHQLFCPTAGNTYPIDKIERFIDDNKALMRRMYGDFEMSIDTGPRQQNKKRKRRFIDDPDEFIPPGELGEAGESYFGKLRNKRQSGNQNRNNNRPNLNRSNGPGSTATSGTGRLDACESKVEIVTPYWASNSAGKIRAIVNTQHFEQAIHQEVCSKTQTSRCEGDCGCEQKYKWHRLLAYDPDNDCKGIFMDWFLFPSCCVCRCNP